MFKHWKFILFFLLCLMLALLVNLPVQQVLAQVKLSSSVQLGDIDGTLFKGRVEAITVPFRSTISPRVGRIAIRRRRLF